MCNKKLEVIIEELSHIDLHQIGNTYVLRDKLKDKIFEINSIAYEICRNIDGKKTLGDISAEIAVMYNVEATMVEEDVLEFMNFLTKNKIILIKGTLFYKFIKLYNNLIFADKVQ